MGNTSPLTSLSTLAQQAHASAEAVGAKTGAELLDILNGKLQNLQLHVCFVGRTSVGKTTILNSLLERPILPYSADPTTAVVVEVRNSTDGSYRFLIVGGDKKQAEVTGERFAQLCRDPGETRRLVVEEPELRFGLQARLFDTPGYDSIYDKHSEVLTDFIPQADFLVIVLLYRQGVVAADATFLKGLRDIFGDDLPPSIVVINRVPPETGPEDRRLIEIRRHIAEILGKEPETFLVPNIDVESDTHRRAFDPLWQHLAVAVREPGRLRRMAETSKELLYAALESVLEHIDLTLAARKADINVLEELRQNMKELRLRQRELHAHIDTRAAEIKQVAETELEEQAAMVQAACRTCIDEANRWTGAQECSAFLTNHVMPQAAMESSRVIGQAVWEELDRLDKEIEDMANTAVGHFHRRLEMAVDHFEALKENLAKKVANEVARKSGFAFLARFGGRGGAGAGVANFSKMALKKVGKLFNKTFSRQTHNALAQFVKRIGLTSARNVAIAITVLIEVVFGVLKAATWKNKLKKYADKSVRDWVDKMKPQLEDEIGRAIEETRASLNEAIDFHVRELEEALEHEQTLHDSSEESVYQGHRRQIDELKQELSSPREWFVVEGSV